MNLKVSQIFRMAFCRGKAVWGMWIGNGVLSQKVFNTVVR